MPFIIHMGIYVSKLKRKKGAGSHSGKILKAAGHEGLNNEPNWKVLVREQVELNKFVCPYHLFITVF